MSTEQILLLAIPIVIVELGLLVFALRDLLRPERRVRGDSKLMWGLIIILVNFIGPILYFVVGREEE
jgi:Phospholipase_D-nuclease N-terminal